jgi:hypothetical protein
VHLTSKSGTGGNAVVLADSDPRFAGGRGGKIAQMAAAAEHQRSIPPSLVIGRLIDKGVSAGDVKKLQSAGYGTWLAVDTASKRELLKVKGLPEVRIDKIKVSAGLCWPSDEACTELLRQNSKSYKQLQVEEDRGMAGHKLQLSTADEMLERFPHLAKLFFIYHHEHTMKRIFTLPLSHRLNGTYSQSRHLITMRSVCFLSLNLVDYC